MNGQDTVIVGGGIVGLATALALLDRGITPLVLEAEAGVARHQTGHNSGVIHAGLYYKPGSLKARLCADGREALFRFCATHAIPHERCGKLVVATTAAQLPALDQLVARGRANGLEVERVSAESLPAYEPHARGIAGLWVPETGIVDYSAVARAMARLVAARGGTIHTATRLIRAHSDPDGVTVTTSRGTFRAGRLIACAGLQADRVARRCGVAPGVRIVPFRGEYYTLRPAARHLVRNLIYPVPDPAFPFLGVHFTRRIDGSVEAGPNAVLAFRRHGYRRTSFSPRDSAAVFGYAGFWRLARRYWRTGLGEFYRSFSRRAFVRALQTLVPALTDDDVVPGGAGVRAQALAPDGTLIDDFAFARGPRMLHVLNAPSPAATAALAIGRYLADRIDTV